MLSAREFDRLGGRWRRADEGAASSSLTTTGGPAFFENWNRYFDPGIGTYYSLEPILAEDPEYVRSDGVSGSIRESLQLV